MNYLYDFTSDSNSDWQVVDDRVMGGVSQGIFTTNQEGNGVFSGHVSLENNGGFSSVMHQLNGFQIEDAQKVILKVKGDKKAYQFRLKANNSDAHSFIQSFQTNGEWQEIELPLNGFYASFRGRKLDMPNFSADKVAEIRFLIANKKDQDFRLEIDWIALK
ncbi:MAG: CIA30 family protein [Vicingaceae bacterium]